MVLVCMHPKLGAVKPMLACQFLKFSPKRQRIALTTTMLITKLAKMPESCFIVNYYSMLVVAVKSLDNRLMANCQLKILKRSSEIETVI